MQWPSNWARMWQHLTHFPPLQYLKDVRGSASKARMWMQQDFNSSTFPLAMPEGLMHRMVTSQRLNTRMTFYTYCTYRTIQYSPLYTIISNTPQAIRHKAKSPVSGLCVRRLRHARRHLLFTCICYETIDVQLQPKFLDRLKFCRTVGVWTFARFVRPIWATILCVWKIWSGSNNRI